MPKIAPPGIIHNGKPVASFEIAATPGLPDVLSYRRKFGLFIPLTNTTTEYELWRMIFNNPGVDGLEGIGIHTTNVVTPKPKTKTKAELDHYKTQFIGGLKVAVDEALLAQPQYLIMGMSLEHIISGVQEIREMAENIEAQSGLSWAHWHEAATAALRKFKAKRIGLITPFNEHGNKYAVQMFEELGFEVISSVGFACADFVDIAHIPDTAKEKAIRTLLATPENKLDAVVQCGTNMSFINVAEKLEPELGIPILGINAVLFWYALRENGIQSRLVKAGRLLREF